MAVKHCKLCSNGWMIMDELLEQFLQYIQISKTGSKHTLESYRRDIRHFLDYLKGQEIFDLAAVDKKNFLDYAQLLKSGEITGSVPANATFSHAMSSIRSFYRYLNRFHDVKGNPAAAMKTPKTARKLPEFLTFEQMRDLLDSFDLSVPAGLRDRCIVETMYACGLRVSEVASLQVSRLYLDEQLLTVLGKGSKERMIPYYAGLTRLLRQYLYEVRPYLVQQDHDCLFVSLRGKPITPRAIQLMLQQAANQAGLMMNVHPHMIRHSFATHMLDNGADLRMVQELLGHENLSTTQIYTHVTVDRLKEAVKEAHPHSIKKQ